jgi:general secretion pathway protein D
MKQYLLIVLFTIGLSFPCYAISPTNSDADAAFRQAAPQINKNASPNTRSSQLWNLQDVDIRTLIDQVSKQTGKNFIVDPRVQGKVTFVSNTPLLSDELYQVFLAILSTHGFAATQANHAIKIGPIFEANYQPLPTVRPSNTPGDNRFVVQVAAIQNLNAGQLATTLRPLLPPSSQIIAYPQTNTLIITGPADKMTQIDQIIKGLDQPTASNIEIIPLHNAIATQVVSTLKPMLPTAGTQGGAINISADVGGNSILISGPPVDRARIKSIIKQMDILQNTPTTQNAVEVIPLHYLKAKEFAPVLINLVTGQSYAGGNSEGTDTTSDNDFSINNQQAGQGGGYGNNSNTGLANNSNVSGNTGSSPNLNLTLPTLPLLQRATGITNINNNVNSSTNSNPNNIQIVAEDTTNSLVISAPNAELNKLRVIIRELDVKPQQVLIEAIIVEVDETVMENLGIQWGSTLPAGVNMSDSFANLTGGGIGVGVVDFGRIRAIINYLTTNSTSNILSTPSLVVLNNHKAQILVGQQVSFQTGSYATTGSTSTVTPFTTTNQQNVALTLNVIPQIGPDGSIRLLIKQGNQTIANPTQGSFVNGNPVVNEADLVTSIIMNSDQILVLGGLISNDFEDTTSRVPFISQVPIIGEFFKNRSPNDVKKNLMVFLHPVILNNQDSQDAQSGARYGMIRQLEIQKQRAASPLAPVGVNPILPQWKPVHIPEPYPANN